MVGLVEVEQRQDGGGDVAEAAAFAEGGVVAFFGDVEEGDGVGGVGGVGAAGGGVDEHLGVAVVGGDEEAAAALLDGVDRCGLAGCRRFRRRGWWVPSCRSGRPCRRWRS